MADYFFVYPVINVHVIYLPNYVLERPFLDVISNWRSIKIYVNLNDDPFHDYRTVLISLDFKCSGVFMQKV